MESSMAVWLMLMQREVSVSAASMNVCGTFHFTPFSLKGRVFRKTFSRVGLLAGPQSKIIWQQLRKSHS